MLKLFIPLLTGWLIWVSKAVVSLQADVAVLKYGVFKTVSKQETKPPKPTIEADLNVFQFLERKK